MMWIKRLLIAGCFAFVLALAGGCSDETQPPGGNSAASPVNTTLPPANVDTLQKLNSSVEAEKLLAIAPALRENPEVKASLQASNVKVQILPETQRVFDFYATIDAQLSGDVMERVTYYLQPSNGQWLIAGLKKG